MRIRNPSINVLGLMISALVVIGVAKSASADVRVITFDTEVRGVILTEEYLSSHGVEFPHGIEVAADPTSSLGNNVGRPLAAGEFNRQAFVANFTASPHTVSLQVKEDPTGHSATYGQIIVIEMTAWRINEITDIFGNVRRFSVIVDSDSVTFTSGDRTLATLTTNHSDGIEWIEVRMSMGGIANNLYLLTDWLQVESSSAPPSVPPDALPPTISIFGITSVVFSSSLDYRLVVTDDRRISSIQSTITHISTASSNDAPICGSVASGGCPEITYDRRLTISLWDEGSYSLVIRACDASDNCETSTRTFELDLPDAPPAVRPWYLEVNQGTQSRLSDISTILPGSFGSARFSQPILAGKDTVVRWYLLADGADRADFNATMDVYVEYSDGSDRSFAVRPNTGTSADVPADPLAEPDLTQLLKGVMRPDLTRTLNFVIPGSNLVVPQLSQPRNAWPTASLVQLRLRGVTGDVRVPLNLPTYLGLNIFKVSSGPTGPAPTDTQINDIILPYMRNALPVTDVHVFSRSFYRWDGDRDEAGQNFCSALLGDIWWDFGGDDVRFRFRGEGRYTANLAVISNSPDGCSGIARLGDPTDGDYRYGTAAVTRLFADVASHEIGHNVGLEHVGGSHGEANAVAWPYPHGSTGPDDYGVIPVLTGISGQWDVALIDPCLNASAVDLVDRYPCAVDMDGDGNPDDNQNTHDLMSYGAGPDQIAWPTVNGGDTWPSNITYNVLYSGILSGTISGPYASRAVSIVGDSEAALVTESNGDDEFDRVDALIVGGIVRGNGLINLKPLVRKLLPIGMLDQSEGRYRLQLLGTSDSVLFEQYFDTTRTGDSDDLIQLVVPYVEGIKRLVILDGQDIVADESASPHPPTVKVLTPNGGEILSTGIQTVRWEGSDADGDEVTYLVQYSPDSGISWQGLGHRRTGDETEIRFNANELIPGRKGLIRIAATDGINISIDDSDRTFSLGTNEIPIGLSKLLLEGPQEIGIALPETTEYVFRISYANPDQSSPVRIKDTVPAEFNIVSATASSGDVKFYKTGQSQQGRQVSASRIEWELDANEKEGLLTVKISTSVNPGKGHKAPVYKPTACGPLAINNGATAYEVDPETGKIRNVDTQDPLTGIISSQPVIVMGPSNSIEVTAVEGAKPCLP